MGQKSPKVYCKCIKPPIINFFFYIKTIGYYRKFSVLVIIFRTLIIIYNKQLNYMEKIVNVNQP